MLLVSETLPIACHTLKVSERGLKRHKQDWNSPSVAVLALQKDLISVGAGQYETRDVGDGCRFSPFLLEKSRLPTISSMKSLRMLKFMMNRVDHRTELMSTG
jgi:hypothetical protein